MRDQGDENLNHFLSEHPFFELLLFWFCLGFFFCFVACLFASLCVFVLFVYGFCLLSQMLFD